MPLLLVKLWTVYPKLFARPPRDLRRPRRCTAPSGSASRVLVAAAIFQLVTGLANAAQWYPWAFSFRATHYAVAWVAIGALVVHIAVKLPVIRAALGADVESDGLDRPGTRAVTGGLTRRGLLRTTWLASGVAVLATAGSTVPWLRKVSVFGVRSGDGPAGIPINKSARAAGVTAVGHQRRRPPSRRRTATARSSCDPTSWSRCRSVDADAADRLRRGLERQRHLDRRPGARAARPRRRARRQRRARHVPAGARRLPRQHPAGQLRRRPADAAGHRLNGETPGARPRLPLPAHRPQPSRRAADQVGHPAGRDRMMPRAARRSSASLARRTARGCCYDRGWENFVAAGIWLVGGVVLHDGVLAPLVLLACLAATRLLPRIARGPAAAGLVVLGSVTLLAVPVLGRFGARPDNPTLLDRDYALGWVVLAGLTIAGVAVATYVGARDARKGSRGPGAGGRRRPHRARGGGVLPARAPARRRRGGGRRDRAAALARGPRPTWSCST